MNMQTMTGYHPLTYPDVNITLLIKLVGFAEGPAKEPFVYKESQANSDASLLGHFLLWVFWNVTQVTGCLHKKKHFQ